MAVHCERIVLCRGLSEKNDSQDAYLELLKGAGHSCTCLKTLQFEFVNIADLKQCLLSPQIYYGVILTSRRAVEAIDIASKEDKNLLQAWLHLPAYCVGPATESLARDILKFDNCLGSQCGNAKQLAQKIVADLCNESKPILYPCSEIARETVEQILTSKGISLHKLTVYRTLPSETLDKDILNVMDKSSQIFVFFSPSTVDHIVTALKKQSFSMQNIKAVAIGPVTAQALINAGCSIYAIAEKPEPNALLDAINAAN